MTLRSNYSLSGCGAFHGANFVGARRRCGLREQPNRNICRLSVGAGGRSFGEARGVGFDEARVLRRIE